MAGHSSRIEASDLWPKDQGSKHGLGFRVKGSGFRD